MWDLRGDQFITGTTKVFWPFPFLHFCSSISFHSQQFLAGTGSLGGALSGVYSSWMAHPSKPLALRHTPVSPALPKLATMLYQEYLLLILGFSCSQVTRCSLPAPARLDFFLLLPSQMQVLQLSLRCLHPCILSFVEIAYHPMCC